MGVFHTHVLQLTSEPGYASNGGVPIFLVTAEDREWFSACRRSWDLGARVRQDLEPVTDEDPARRRARSIRDGLGVYYFPGMWTWDRSIVDRLMFAAIERGGGGELEKAVTGAYAQWAPTVDTFMPLHIEPDIECNVPDPDQPGSDLVAENVLIVKYRDRPAMLVLEKGDCEEYWLVEHRVVDHWASDDELALDERGILACWAWGQFHLAMPIAGTLYNEVRIDPPEFRRTRVPRRQVEKDQAAARLGRAVKIMLDGPAGTDPTPEWSHCSRCAFRAPCIAMNQGRDPSALLEGAYQHRPPDVLEEGRLGGISWGLSRGAARAYGRKRTWF